MTTEQLEKELGNYNSPLPNMKEISEKEWAQSFFFQYAAECRGYRQISNIEELIAVGIRPAESGGRPCMMPIHWYAFFDKTGIAFFSDWWAGKVRIFKFAVCEHAYTEKNIGHCLTRYTCSKCGHSKDIDSSG